MKRFWSRHIHFFLAGTLCAACGGSSDTETFAGETGTRDVVSIRLQRPRTSDGLPSLGLRVTFDTAGNVTCSESAPDVSPQTAKGRVSAATVSGLVSQLNRLGIADFANDMVQMVERHLSSNGSMAVLRVKLDDYRLESVAWSPEAPLANLELRRLKPIEQAVRVTLRQVRWEGGAPSSGCARLPEELPALPAN